ncbi:MAG TPA: J domain-containing protein [Polyangiaceae bacterium]|jgi:curved DNA-binding protein
MADDFYSELGVSRSATADEIRKAYRKLAAKFHPDKNAGDKKAEARFKAINRAHQALSDPQKRQLYDEFGEDGLREGFDADAARAFRRGGGGRVRFGGVEDLFGGQSGFGDLFSDFFAGGGRQRRGPMKGPDLASEVTVDFPSAIRGAELKLRLQDGGAEVTVRVPPGAVDGDKIRLAGHGAPGPGGGPPGDLVLLIRVQPHRFFERAGLDLHLDLPITIAEAYRGAKVRIPTPDGQVTLTIPKRAQSGHVVRLKGRGVKRKGQQGDLYVRFLVKLPDSDSAAVEKAVDALEAASTGDVRSEIQF